MESPREFCPRGLAAHFVTRLDDGLQWFFGALPRQKWFQRKYALTGTEVAALIEKRREQGRPWRMAAWSRLLFWVRWNLEGRP